MRANSLKYFARVRYVFPCFHEPNLNFTEAGVNYNQQNGCSEKFINIHWGVPVMGLLFLLKPYAYFKKDTIVGVFL